MTGRDRVALLALIIAAAVVLGFAVSHLGFLLLLLILVLIFL